MDASLAEENARLRAELDRIRARLATVQGEEQKGGGGANGGANGGGGDGRAPPPPPPPPPRPPVAAVGHNQTTHHLVRLKHALTTAQCERYARHLVLPAFGAAAQARLCARSALVVGCGGLGAPAALYLAAAGVGRLGLADRDRVEASNLHRQVIHAECRVGVHKALSAAEGVRALNSTVRVETLDLLGGLCAENAARLVSRYDLVLDCTDNAPSRYLLSDACAAVGVPLVSAAAVGTDGQLTVYCRGSVRARGVGEGDGDGGNGGGGREKADDGTNDDDEGDDDDDDTPCYRCLFPDPPAPETCSRCAEAGVLGPVPGVMGVLQALEALKLLGGRGRGGGGGGGEGAAAASREGEKDGGAAAGARPQPAALGETLARRMLLYDAMSARFSTVRLRARRDGCVACGGRRRRGRAGDGGGGQGAGGADEAAKAAGSLRRPGAVAATDYAAFTGQSADDALPSALALISEEERVTAAQLAVRMRQGGSGERAVDGAAPDAAAAGAAASALSPAAAGGRGALVILDVRPRAQFDVMALSGAVNVPFAELDRRWQEVELLLAPLPCRGGGPALAADAADGAAPSPPPPSVVVVCRRGNHSQLCARRLRAALVAGGVTEEQAKARVRDLVGGYEAWAASCEPHVPIL